jgi:hypothetical protein
MASPDSIGPMTSFSELTGETKTVSRARSISAVLLTSTEESARIQRRKNLEEKKRRSLQFKRDSLERRRLEPSSSAPLSYLTVDARHFVFEGKEVEWTGPVLFGLPSGYGRMLFQDGQIYEGECRAGNRHGRGRNVWPNQQIFTGEWDTNRRVRGTHTWPDGRSCTGSWNNGHLNGRVTCSWPDGGTFDGEAVAGKQHGRGTQVWSDGRTYTGQYFEGLVHGLGTLTEPDQRNKFRGSFRNGKRHGHGVQIWGSMTYDGAWKDDRIHGSGLLTWTETGATYKGLFAEGLYHGHGCYQSGDGKDGYVGQWQRGLKSGVGKEYSSDGSVYEGDFVDDEKEGFGCMVFPSGRIYSGGWKGGKQHGQGMEVDETGNIVRCGFWGDETPSQLENGTSTVISTGSDESSGFESVLWVDLLHRNY